MDGRASQSIAGTHLNAWPPPVALLKFTSLFFFVLLSTPSCRTLYAVLFLPLSFHRPSTSKSRIWVCLSQRQVAFYCTASYSPRLDPFGSFPPLFDSCLGCFTRSTSTFLTFSLGFSSSTYLSLFAPSLDFYLLLFWHHPSLLVTFWAFSFYCIL